MEIALSELIRVTINQHILLTNNDHQIIIIVYLFTDKAFIRIFTRYTII